MGVFMRYLSALTLRFKLYRAIIKGKAAKHDVYAKHVQKRGASNPSTCGTDTSTFTDLSSIRIPTDCFRQWPISRSVFWCTAGNNGERISILSLIPPGIPLPKSNPEMYLLKFIAQDLIHSHAEPL